jgi:hypothetical protein
MSLANQLLGFEHFNTLEEDKHFVIMSGGYAEIYLQCPFISGYLRQRQDVIFIIYAEFAKIVDMHVKPGEKERIKYIENFNTYHALRVYAHSQMKSCGVSRPTDSFGLKIRLSSIGDYPSLFSRYQDIKITFADATKEIFELPYESQPSIPFFSRESINDAEKVLDNLSHKFVYLNAINISHESLLCTDVIDVCNIIREYGLDCAINVALRAGGNKMALSAGNKLCKQILKANLDVKMINCDGSVLPLIGRRSRIIAGAVGGGIDIPAYYNLTPMIAILTPFKWGDSPYEKFYANNARLYQFHQQANGMQQFVERTVKAFRYAPGCSCGLANDFKRCIQEILLSVT